MMKYVLFITGLVFAGCVGDNPIDIEGIYTRESASEYSRALDTLTIYKYDSSAGSPTYLIRRKTGYIRIVEGVPQTKQYKDEQIVAVYDENSNQLTDQKTGRLFTFKEGELLFGTASYKRLPPAPKGE